MKVFDGDLFFERFLFAIGVELADLFSSAIRTTLKVCHNALLALRIETQRHGSDVNQKQFNIPLETCFPRESTERIKFWTWYLIKLYWLLLNSFYYLLTKPFAKVICIINHKTMAKESMDHSWIFLECDRHTSFF